MTRVLLAFDHKSIALFLPNYLNGNSSDCFVNVVQDSIVAYAKLPSRFRIGAKRLDAAGINRRMMPQVKLYAVQDYLPGIGAKPSQVGLRNSRNTDRKWFSHVA
jgi:hypothetical protein